MFTIHDLLRCDCKPAPYEPGAQMWNDAYISTQMLAAHLSPDTDAASYRPRKIKAVCDYLPRALGLKEGVRLVDLGCGPGLYANRFAEMGCAVTGIDLSQHSIAYAAAHAVTARERFKAGSYLEPFGEGEFDAALLVSEDYGVLPPSARKTLLANVRDALKTGGRFALDVSSLYAYEQRKSGARDGWYTSEMGFWRPHAHAVLQKTYFYEELSALCDFYAVLDTGITVYRIYQTCFSCQSITQELEQSGFAVKEVLSALWGEPYREDTETIAIVCERV